MLEMKKKNEYDKLHTVYILASVIFLGFVCGYISLRIEKMAANPLIKYIPLFVFVAIITGQVFHFRYKSYKSTATAVSYYELLEGLSDDYDTILLFDLDNDSVEILKANEGIMHRYMEEQKKGGKSFRNFFLDYIISDESREHIAPMFEEDYIKDKLTESPSIYFVYNIRYKDRSRHHYENKLMRLRNFDKKKKFIFATRCIDRQEADENSIRKYLEDTVLERTEELREKNERLNRLNEDIIAFLGNIVEARDTESGEHVRRVKGFTYILAKQVMNDYPEYGLTEERIELITSASALHDLGKITIPDAILLKPGRLTSDEFETMKLHSTKGCEILKLAPMDWSEEYLQTSLEICKYHHEKYDGNGYPEGLKGDAIPISAQIVSIVDCFDALINKRCYKDAYPVDKAVEMIANGECGVFSPKLMNCFLKCKERFIEHFNSKRSDFSMPVAEKTADFTLAGIKFLLVEDDSLSRDITASILRGSGANVVETSSGDEAIAIISESEKDSFDAILLDLYMPGMNGFDTAKKIRESRVYGCDIIPIIAISVSHDDKDVEKATEMGMNAYLFKPINIRQVSKALMYCMKDQTNKLQKKLTKTSRVASRDTLTGVRNMAAYMDKVEQLKEKVRHKFDGAFALVECDLNGLKGVNDTYGHDIGDVYIVNCCHAICDIFKHSPVFRVGGDEFVVVLEGEDLANRNQLMEDLKNLIEEKLNLEDPVHGRISIASGMAVYDSNIDKTVGDVLKRADISMYNNKRVMHMTVSD